MHRIGSLNRIERTVILIALAVVAMVVGTAWVSAGTADTNEPNTPAVAAGSDLSAPGSTPALATAVPSAIGPLGFTDTQKRDAYRAWAQAETGVQAVMDAIAAIRQGDVAGEPLTTDQLTAIQDRGLSGLVLAQARIADGLAILGLSQTTLDTWAASNPAPDVVWCHETPENCAD